MYCDKTSMKLKCIINKRLKHHLLKQSHVLKLFVRFNIGGSATAAGKESHRTWHFLHHITTLTTLEVVFKLYNLLGCWAPLQKFSWLDDLF